MPLARSSFTTATILLAWACRGCVADAAVGPAPVRSYPFPEESDSDPAETMPAAAMPADAEAIEIEDMEDLSPQRAPPAEMISMPAAAGAPSGVEAVELEDSGVFIPEAAPQAEITPAPAIPSSMEAMENEGSADVFPELAPLADEPSAELLAEEGELRLIRMMDIGSSGFVGGILQVFLDGAFGAVCRNNFGPRDATVACRQLGFAGGIDIDIFDTVEMPRDLERDQDAFAPVVLENLNCTGAEERLVDCPGITEPLSDYYYSYQSLGGVVSTCDAVEGQYAYVMCGALSGPDAGVDIRLAPGGASEDGRSQFGALEVFGNGGWAPVCDSSFDPDSPFSVPASFVNAACRQLGFGGGERTLVGSDTIGPTPRILPADSCPAGAQSLSECPGTLEGASDDLITCRSIDTDPVGVVCFDSPEPGMEGSLRLAEGQAGPGYEYGRLEIFLRGLWQAVCDGDGFTPDSAAVACSALGFDGGAAIEFRRPYEREDLNNVLASALPVGLGAVDCVGNETSLLECPARSAVALTRNPFSPCKIDLSFGEINTKIFTDATVLACGDTSAASGCPAANTAPAQGSVRLRGGFGTPCDPIHTGFVEVFNAGEWGAVCNRASGSRPLARAADQLAASAVCRQLGFPHGTVVDPTAAGPDAPAGGRAPEEATEPQDIFWLREVDIRCLGVEARLVDCDLGQGFLSPDATGGQRCPTQPSRLTVACRRFAIPEALEAVTTPGAVEGDVRLVEDTSVSNWRTGGLELFFEGSWGQVCAAGLTPADAAVACRQMGFTGGAIVPGSLRTPGGEIDSERRLVFAEVTLAGSPGCTGAEATLLECALAPSGQRAFGECRNDFSFPQTVSCVAEAEAGTEGAVRLVAGGDEDNDPEGGVGILEIFHAGAWGTVCNGDPEEEPRFNYLDYNTNTAGLPEEAAAVACRQLGFSGGEFRNVDQASAAAAAAPLRPSWLADITCATGMEASLADCGPLAFGDTGTCGFVQRLICSNGSDSEDMQLLTPRLVDSEADPGGAWAYGRLEVFDGAAFVSVSDGSFNQELGREAVQVACRTLGFATGGQALTGSDSVLPDPEGRDGTVGNIICAGDEESLTDCTTDIDTYLEGRSFAQNYDFNVRDTTVALVCSNPSGCVPDSAAPQQGDVRLVPLNGIDFATQPCDDVHIGGVEFFNDGRWGRICFGSFRTDTTWTVDATVVCRQLGFPFGGLMDTELGRSRTNAEYEDYQDFTGPVLPTWASIVLCKGTEGRLDECAFPEGLEDVSAGLPRGRCRDSETLSVICRRFPMEESDVIRRL